MRLDPQAAEAGVRLTVYDSVASTNTEALMWARGGDRGPMWCVARAQTAGRGRHGRRWASEPGNLYATLLLTNPAPPQQLAQLAFVTGLAVFDAAAEAAPCLREQLALKWPNDLLCNGAKLAGILIEGEGAAVAIGIGINCRQHPGGTLYPATDLAAEGADVDAEDVFVALTRTMLGRLNQWHRGTGFAFIRREWLARAHALGGDIRVRLNNRQIEGRFEDLAEDGSLILRQRNGIVEVIAAGDVFPLTIVAAD